MNDGKRKNLVMYRPGRPGHVESFFFKVTDPNAGWGLWIKFTILAPTVAGREPVASVWATRISAKNPHKGVGIRNTLSLSRCSWSADKAGMTVGACSFGAGWTKGRLRDGLGQEIAWDFRFDADAPGLELYAAQWMYTAPVPRFKIATPYADGRAHGYVERNGARKAFENLPCMQGHNWGDAHAPTYAWTHCNAFDGAAPAMYEGFSAKVQVAGRQTPFLSSAALRVDGRTHWFNRMGGLLARDIAINRQSYGVTLNNPEYELRAIAVAHRQDFAGLMYPNPDLSHRLCVNSSVANLTLELTHRKSGERAVKLVSTQGAMLELISPENWCDVCIFVPPMDGRDETGALAD